MTRRLSVCAFIGTALLIVAMCVPTAALPAPRTKRVYRQPLSVVDLRKTRPVATPRPLPSLRPVAMRKAVEVAKPTVAPSAPTAAPVVVPAGSVQERIAAAWPGDDAKVLRVVKCESNFNPRAVSRSGKYRGLLQADASFWRSYGGHEYAPSADQSSVEGQMAVMWRGYQARGWTPWPHCGKR